MPCDHPQLTIRTMYHPPGSDDWAMLSHIDQSVDYIIQASLMGDLIKMKYSRLKQNHNLKQIVDLPTRGNAILDSMYTNIPNFCQRFVISAPIGLSDHKMIVCIPSTSSNYIAPVVSSTPSRSYRPRDLARFAVVLKTTSWETLFRLPISEVQLNFFNSTIKPLLDVHLPKRQIRLG